MRYILVFFLSIYSCLVSGRILEGQDRGNGGDLCEQRIYQISSNLKHWITQGGSAMLVFPADISVSKYNTAMLEQITKAVVSCTGETLGIGSVEKTCINFADNKGRSRITCNYQRFMNAEVSAQYVLIHHELAGLAKFEINKGERSDYRISDQLTDYFQSDKMESIENKSVDQCPADPFLSDEERMALAIYNNNLRCVEFLSGIINLNLDQTISLAKIKTGVRGMSILGFTRLPALSFAAALGRAEVVSILVNANAYPSDDYQNPVYPLTLAVKAGHVEVIKILVRSGAAFHGLGNLLTVALSNLKENSYPLTTIYRTVEALLLLGVNPNEDSADLAPLSMAAENMQLVDLLIQYGSSPFKTDNKGRTPIFFCRTEACVTKFVGLGVDVNTVDGNGNQAIEIVETEEAKNALLSHGAVLRKVARAR